MIALIRCAYFHHNREGNTAAENVSKIQLAPHVPLGVTREEELGPEELYLS